MTEQQPEPTLTALERVAVALLFAVAIAVSIVVVGRVADEPDEVVGPPDARPVLDADVPWPVPVREAVELAAEWAEEWDAGAWPILVSAQFEFPMDSGEATPTADLGSVLVTFAAPEENDEWPRLTLAVSRQSGTIFYEDELSSSVEPPSSVAGIIGDLPITAEQAFRVAQQVVGEEYRVGCEPSRRETRVILDTTDREDPHWVVVYYDQRERNVNDIVVRIDAQTGATETKIRDDTSC